MKLKKDPGNRNRWIGTESEYTAVVVSVVPNQATNYVFKYALYYYGNLINKSEAPTLLKAQQRINSFIEYYNDARLKGFTTVSVLEDIQLKKTADSQFLSYNSSKEKWVNLTYTPALTHNHDDRYYIKAELTALFEEKQDAGNNPPVEDGVLIYENGRLIWRTLLQASIAATYRDTFTSADLVGDTLTVIHNLGSAAVVVSVFDNNSSPFRVIPGSVEAIDENTVLIDFHGFSISGTWKVIVQG